MEKTLTCVICSKTWTVEVRGRQPKYCAVCKADPKQLKKLVDEQAAQKRAAAAKRIKNLEANLLAGGNHLSQQPAERRSYSLAEIDERIHQLEEWRKSLDERLSRQVEDKPSPDSGAKKVRKQPVANRRGKKTSA